MMNAIKNKKTLFFGISAAAILLLGAALAVYLLAPSQRIALDVNPSIELKTNRLNQVLSITPVNEDARKVLAGYTLQSSELDDVVENLVDRMIQEGYLGKDKQNDVLITVDDTMASAKTLKKVNETIAAYVSNQQWQADIYAQRIDMERYSEQAAALQVSPGKMCVISRLLQGDTTLTPEDLANTRVSDLLAFAQEHNIPLDLLEDQLDTLEDLYDDNEQLDKLEDQLDEAKEKLEAAQDSSDEAADLDEIEWEDEDENASADLVPSSSSQASSSVSQASSRKNAIRSSSFYNGDDDGKYNEHHGEGDDAEETDDEDDD